MRTLYKSDILTIARFFNIKNGKHISLLALILMKTE